MLAKLSYIDIGDKKYPMSFSLSSAKRMGRLSELSKGFDKDNVDLVQAASMLSDILHVMICTGCTYCNAMHLPPYDQAPIDRNGRFIPIKKEEMEVLIPLEAETMKVIIRKIQECVSNGKKRELQAVPSKKVKKKRVRR